LASAVSGAAAIPMLRIGGYLGDNWDPALVRPPGALSEKEFLSRCIKCGQCMRICPTNVIHPAGMQGGLEGLWTPVLNFRMGTSGCQFNCIACGNLCPTAAIRPISIDERLGKNRYAEQGPIKIGTAFVDRGRCLPWAMDSRVSFARKIAR
jgi:ferredoxin